MSTDKFGNGEVNGVSDASSESEIEPMENIDTETTPRKSILKLVKWTLGRCPGLMIYRSSRIDIPAKEQEVEYLPPQPSADTLNYAELSAISPEIIGRQAYECYSFFPKQVLSTLGLSTLEP